MYLANYEIFNPPLPLDFYNWDRKQAKEYFLWFQENIPVRLDVLRRALMASNGGNDFLDFTKESLALLGQWIEPYFELRPLTDEEIAHEKSRLPDWFKELVVKEVLSEQSISLCIDR